MAVFTSADFLREDPIIGGELFQPNPTDIVVDPHEVEFQNYLYEQWHEEEVPWSPLITLEQLSKRPDPEMEWYCEDWIPVGAKTIICAKTKCGKTIVLFHLLKAITEGGKFMGRKCVPAKVLYFTEQNEREFKKQIREIPGLLGNPNFFVMLSEELPQYLRTWKDILTFAGKMMAITGAKIVIFDTFLTFARLGEDQENDSASIQNAINDMSFLFKQQRYLSIVLTHHTKKLQENDKSNRRGEMHLDIDDIRGSTAFSGGVGHIIMMRDFPDKSSRRHFLFKGRYINDVEIEAFLTNEHEYHQKSYHSSN